jgi:hypothetical protein
MQWDKQGARRAERGMKGRAGRREGREEGITQAVWQKEGEAHAAPRDIGS